MRRIFPSVIAIGGLPITIDQQFPLAGYEDALARLEHGEQLGKIVLNHEES